MRIAMFEFSFLLLPHTTHHIYYILDTILNFQCLSDTNQNQKLKRRKVVFYTFVCIPTSPRDGGGIKQPQDSFYGKSLHFPLAPQDALEVMTCCLSIDDRGESEK